MIEIRQNEIVIVDRLKEHLGVEVVMANQSSPLPPYPYVSYTVTTLMKANNGTWSEYEDGTKRKEVQQIWSFTIQADNDTESKVLAIKAHNYFDETGTLHLNDKGIVVQHLEDISNRDNFLTTGYEYRNGFDVTLAFMNEVIPEESSGDIIVGISFGNEIAVDRTIDRLNDLLEQRLDGDEETESTLAENVVQAISDFDEIEKALEESGINVPDGADTSKYGDYVRELGKSIGVVTLTKYTEADIKDGDS